MCFLTPLFLLYLSTSSLVVYGLTGPLLWHIHTLRQACFSSRSQHLSYSLQVASTQRRLATLTGMFRCSYCGMLKNLAARYVPHANRALRSFNVYLNVRYPPLRSSLNPFSYLFPRTPSTTPSQQSSNPVPRASSPRRAPAIPPIPPTSNPRGELIFSSRVDPTFRESYERYRAAFERKREEQKRANRGGSWFGFLTWPWQKAKQQQQQQNMLTPHGGGGLRGQTPSTTPSSSRRSSPAPGTTSKGSLRRGKTSRTGTPALEATLLKEKESHRTESFSFLLAGQEASHDPL